MNPLKKFVLFFLTSTLLITSSAQCPSSKYGIIPFWPQNWTNSDKTNWYQMMQSKGNGFTQTNFTWIEADNLLNSGQVEPYVNYISAIKNNYNLKYHLSIKNPATNVNYIPSAYTGMDFEDTVLTKAYFQFATNLIDSFAPVVDYFSIGVECDIYFKDHPNEIDEFVELYADISNYVHSNYPNIKISSAVTFGYGIKNNDIIWQSTKNFSDVLCITYWPLNPDFTVISTAISDIALDMNTLILKAGSKPIIIKEWGFPSSTIVNSSEIIQLNFTKELFRQTMNNPQFEGIEWTFLSDFNSSTVNSWASFHQTNSAEFKGYIGSLGLMDTLGVEKPVYQAYLQMMDSVCLNSFVNEYLPTDNLIIYPNPAKYEISIICENGYKIFNSQGIILKQSFIKTNIIDISDLNKGLYFINIGNKTTKFLKL